MARQVMDPKVGPVWVLDSGMADVAAAKSEHFEAFSGQRRTRADLDAIAQAAYRVRDTYGDAEDLYLIWAYASVPPERAVRYILAEMTDQQALDEWEPRFTGEPHEAEEALAALDLIVGLRMPAHARQCRTA